MRIEAITVCVNYSDFLEHSLPENVQHVDHMVVVTTRGDKKTKDLCNHYGVTCIDTDVFYEHGDKFNKGRGINVGMQHCRQDGYLLHIDADTVLPHRFKNTVQMAHLDPACIYGADRLNAGNYCQWMQEQEYLTPQFQDGCFVNAHHKFKMGNRLLHGDYGYCPIGYFQMWHSSEKRRYPSSGGSGEHTDVMFAIQWPRQKRVLLPQLFVYHLESENAEMGVNWQGRKTKPFECGHGHHHWRRHKRHHPHKPYCK